MIIVTGGAGFIGSNIVKGLNHQGFYDILVVDDLTDGRKFKNIVDVQIQDYCDKDEFLKLCTTDAHYLDRVEAIFHQGACSDTTEWDGAYMMKVNYRYSVELFNQAIRFRIPFIYASSAAVYGASTTFKEERQFEGPLNVYGFSKWLFDQYVRRELANRYAQVVGLRYFNVYGPNEAHKGTMASIAFHHQQQIQTEGIVKLFEGNDGYGNGEQRRDFIYIDDVVKVNLWCWQQFLTQREISGIYNVGTGRSQTFNDVANAVIQGYGNGHIEYIPFPEHLKGRYQSFTEADLSLLRTVGYNEPFHTVEEGVKKYMDCIVAA